MTQVEGQAGAPAAAPTPDGGAPQATVTPNAYHFHGGGITVSYFPDGFGSLTAGGPEKLMYQDAQKSMSFSGQDLRIVDVPDLGTLISATIVRTVDVGSTSFTLVLPHVTLPQGSDGPVSVVAEGITTVHRAFVAVIGHAQAETYHVTTLRGTALRQMLPLAASPSSTSP